MLNYTDMALDSWYKVDNPLRQNPEPAVMGLAGEAGEIIDYLKKAKYKPGREFDRDEFIEELGDLWYYYRITAWIYNIDLRELLTRVGYIQTKDTKIELASVMLNCSANVLNTSTEYNKVVWIDMIMILAALIKMLALVDCDIDLLTKLNYEKLNQPGQHGWEKAR